MFFRLSLGLDPAVPGVHRKSRGQYTSSTLRIPEGRRIYLDLVAVAQDASLFSSPNEVTPMRPPGSYRLLHGDGVFKILGEDFVYGTAASVLQAVFSLKNIRRAPGPTGTLRRYVSPVPICAPTCVTPFRPML